MQLTHHQMFHKTAKREIHKSSDLFSCQRQWKHSIWNLKPLKLCSTFLIQKHKLPFYMQTSKTINLPKKSMKTHHNIVLLLFFVADVNEMTQCEKMQTILFGFSSFFCMLSVVCSLVLVFCSWMLFWKTERLKLWAWWTD